MLNTQLNSYTIYAQDCAVIKIKYKQVQKSVSKNGLKLDLINPIIYVDATLPNAQFEKGEGEFVQIKKKGLHERKVVL